MLILSFWTKFYKNQEILNNIIKKCLMSKNFIPNSNLKALLTYFCLLNPQKNPFLKIPPLRFSDLLTLSIKLCFILKIILVRTPSNQANLPSHSKSTFLKMLSSSPTTIQPFLFSFLIFPFIWQYFPIAEAFFTSNHIHACVWEKNHSRAFLYVAFVRKKISKKKFIFNDMKLWAPLPLSHYFTCVCIKLTALSHFLPYSVNGIFMHYTHFRWHTQIYECMHEYQGTVWWDDSDKGWNFWMKFEEKCQKK